MMTIICLHHAQRSIATIILGSCVNSSTGLLVDEIIRHGKTTRRYRALNNLHLFIHKKQEQVLRGDMKVVGQVITSYRKVSDILEKRYKKTDLYNRVKRNDLIPY